MSDELPPLKERLDAAEQCFREILSDVKSGAYCDYLVKIEQGMTKIWFRTTKKKPK